jgi:predicted GIY-YIG superfamily endonuclease
MRIVRIYVIRCNTPGFWYVGQTTRLPWERLAEHEASGGSIWTSRHGTDCMIFSAIVPAAEADTLESQLTMVLMARYGWAQVRGGDHMYSRQGRYASQQKFWLPRIFRDASFADILKLRSGSVTHLGPQLSRLVNLFGRFRNSKHANHLHSQPLA